MTGRLILKNSSAPAPIILWRSRGLRRFVIGFANLDYLKTANAALLLERKFDRSTNVHFPL